MKRYRFRFFRFGRSRRSTPVRGTSVVFKRFSSFEGLELRSMLSGSSLLSDSALVSTATGQDVHESPIDQLSIANFMASSISAAPLAANATEDGEASDAPNADPLVDTFKATVTVVLEDLNGNVITEVVAGRQFKVKIFVTDVRTDPESNGVAGAFVALNFNSSLVSLADANSLVVAEDFRDFLESKNTATAGKIAAGGIWLETSPANLPDAGEAQLLWSATLNATTSGNVNFTTSYEEFSQDTELFMFGEDAPTDPAAFDFQSKQLAVVSQPSVSITDVSKTETNAAQDYVFTVKLSSASTSTVSVAYTTGGGTATAGSDYTAKSGTLTFTAGVTQQLVTISVLGDTNAEASETFNVTLSDPTNAALGDATGLGTILDDDAPTIAIQSVSKVETDGVTSIVFTVTISKVSTGDVTVAYTTQDGTATTANNDYTAKSGTLTFAANGSGPQLLTVTINGDEVQELDETFKVVLSSPAGGVLDETNDEATGTILNDDGPVLSLGPTTITHNEGDANSNVVFTVSLTEANDQPVIVVYNTVNGTATPGSDYTTKNGTLTFAAGSTTAQLITIEVIGDNLDEVNETFSLVLSAPQNATVAAGTSVVTITDDDVPNISFEGPSSVNENNGNYVVTVKLSSASPEVVTVAYNTADGNATAGSDYTGKSGTLTFAVGQTSQLITISLTGDANVEASETFTINLSGATNAEITQSAFTATIANDDAVPTVEVIAPASQNEGNSGGTPFVFTVRLSASSNEAITVAYTTANAIAQSGSDYTAISGTLTFAPGTTQQLVTVLVTGDTVRENSNETFRIDLTNPTGATLKSGGSSATATIVDDDPAPPISISDATVTEGDSGTKQILFTVTLANTSEQSVTVQYATQDGTAKANGDYTAASGTLTFAAGQTVQVITINVVGDLFNEENETFSVVLSSPSGGTIADGTGLGTITDEATDNVNIVPSTISGKVFVDNNGNGAQNGMEKVLAGIQVNLTGGATMQTTTNADGTYTFANLEPGTYTVKFTLPTQYKKGAAVIGSQGGTAVDNGYTFTIAAPGGLNGTNNHFATRGLQFQFLSQRMFIASEVAGANDLPAGQVSVSINTVTNPISGSNAASTSISGTGTAGALISVVASAGGTSTAPQSATVAANGTWTINGINVVTLPDGNVTYTVTATGSGTTDTDTIVSKKDTVGPTVDIGSVTNPVNAGNATDTAISGTGEVGATISVVVSDANSNNIAAVTTTVAAGGTWSIGGINVGTLANGELTYTVTAKDAAGNTTVKTIKTTKDSEAPALAVTTIPTTIGTSTQGSVTIGGTGSPNATITVKISDSSAEQVGPLTTTVAQDGTWSIPAINLTSLDAGTLTVTVVATDGSNNTTSVTKIIQKILTTDLTVDAIEDPANAETADSFVLTGTCAIGATVKIVANDTNAGTPATTEVTATVDGQGNWTATINLSALTDGTITFTVTATDTLGNTKTLTPTTTKDTDAPDLEADEVGAIGINNADEVALGGSTEVGATVTIVANDTDAGTPATAAVTATVDAEGDWTAEIDVTGLVDGTITFTITSRDAAGNVTTVTRTATKTTLTVNAIEGSINENEDDDVTLSGTGQATAVIKVIATDEGTGETTEYQTTVATNGTWSISDIDLSELADGDITFTVTATLGGKTVTKTATAVKDTVVAPFDVDTLEDPINIEDLEGLDLAGSVEPGSTVKVEAEDELEGTTGELTAVVDASGNWTLTVDVSELADGDVTFTLTATDAAGNVKVLTVTVTKDTEAPELAVDDVDPIGIDNGDEAHVEGTSEPGAVVTIVANDGDGTTPATAPVTPTVDAQGNWMAEIDVTDLADGTITFTITSRDAAGNVTTVTKTATKTTVAVTELEGTINEVEAEGVALSGTGQPGATIKVVATKGAGSSEEKTTTIALDGTWSVTGIDISELTDGEITFTVTATLSGKSAIVTTTAVKDTVVSPLTVAAVADPIQSDELEDLGLSGTVEPGSTVKIVATDELTGETNEITAVVDAAGNWTATIDVSELADGTITFTITATDAAGNVDEITTESEKDTTAPALTVEDVVAIGISNSDAVPLEGTVEPGAVVTIVANDDDANTPATAAVTATVDAEGDWTASVNVSSLSDGEITFVIRATDAAGNVTEVTKTTLKVTVAINEIESAINNAEADDVTVSGTGEAGAAVKVVATRGAGTSDEYETVIAENGTWSIAGIDISDLADGAILFTATATKNAKTAVATMTATKDTIAELEADALDEPLQTDELESLVLTGTAEPGATVKVSAEDENAGTVGEVNAVVDAEGNWTATLNVAGLDDGQITFTIDTTDAAGNTAQLTKTAAKDTEILLNVAQPNTPIPLAELNAVHLNGVVDQGSTVTIVVDDTDGGTNPTPAVNATVGIAGTWNASVNVSGLSDGTLTFTVTAVDAAGNVSVKTVTAVKDTTTEASIQLENGAISAANYAAATLSGACESEASITVAATDGVTTVERTLTGAVGGGWSITDFNFTTLADGPVTVQVVATDALGNVKSATINVTKDISIPELTVNAVAAITADNEDSLAVSGTVTPGSTVTIVANDEDGNTPATAPISATVDAGGNWTASVDVSGLSDGTITFTVTASDTVNEVDETTSAEKDSIVEPLAFADGAFGDEEDWLTFFE